MVSKSIPDNAVVLVVPSLIINYFSSRDFIRFNREKNRPILEEADQGLPVTDQEVELRAAGGA